MGAKNIHVTDHDLFTHCSCMSHGRAFVFVKILRKHMRLRQVSGAITALTQSEYFLRLLRCTKIYMKLQFMSADYMQPLL